MSSWDAASFAMTYLAVFMLGLCVGATVIEFFEWLEYRNVQKPELFDWQEYGL